MRLANLDTAERLPTHGDFIAQILGRPQAQAELPQFTL